MTEDERLRPHEPPADEPDDESEVGGMTGATGSLTPPVADEPFIPAERREIADPHHQAAVTREMRTSRPSPAPPPGPDEQADAPDSEPEHY